MAFNFPLPKVAVVSDSELEWPRVGWHRWRDIKHKVKRDPCRYSEHLFHYVVVRTDLPPGILAANITHAAGESSPGNLPSGTHAVVLAVPNEDALRTVAARLEQHGIKHVVIDEPDPPYCGAKMAIGVVPGPKEELKRALSSLPLLR